MFSMEVKIEEGLTKIKISTADGTVIYELPKHDPNATIIMEAVSELQRLSLFNFVIWINDELDITPL